MDAISGFKEAALCLQQESCYKKLQETREANDSDEALQKMVNEYGALRISLEEALKKGEGVVELDAMATRLYGEIMAYPGIIAYHKAKAEAEQQIAFLGEIITTAMNGGDPMAVQMKEPAGCSGSCASCGGCGHS